MPSPRFDANIITAAKRLHDNRTAASADPSEAILRYSQVLLEKYQNMAVRDTVRDVYLKYGDRFETIIPEMVKESADIILTSGTGPLPTDCWIALECSKNDYTWYAWRIKENTLKVKAGRDAMMPHDVVTKPIFYQTGSSLVVLPTTITGPARIWYIPEPADMTAGFATDIQISPMWDSEIVERMIAMGNADAKSSIAL